LYWCIGKHVHLCGVALTRRCARVFVRHRETIHLHILMGSHMHTISILSQKGGSGKSTLSQCLAVAGELDDKATAILDMDPQGSSYLWWKRRRATFQARARERDDDPTTVTVNPLVISVTQANYRDEWERLRDLGADLIIIDTPPRLDQWAMKAAELADLTIIPSAPSIKELERVEDTIKLAWLSSQKPVFVLLNKVRPQGDRTAQAEELIRSKKLPVCPTRFGYRVAFEDADSWGETPQEYDPKGTAALEIERVYRYTTVLLRQLTNDEVHHGAKEAELGSSDR